MANKTNLSSWGNLRNYLRINVDPDKDWDNEEIKDYNQLLGAQAAGKVSGDKLTEGRNLFQQYLADAQATDVYRQAQAKAENDARKASEYTDFLTTRLASYLPQLQGNAGIKGYLGITDGQAVALKNNQENAFRAIQSEKRTALQKALETYQGALASNSATAIDQATAIDAARDKRIADERIERQNRLAKEEDIVSKSLSDYLYGIETANGMISAKNAQRIKDYIGSADMSDEAKARLLRDFELNYEGKIIGEKDPHHKMGEGYTVTSVDNKNATVSINGKSLSVNLIRHASVDDAKKLNFSSTGNTDSNPDLGTIEEKDGVLYIYANKGMGDHGWFEIGDIYGSTTASQLLSEWNNNGYTQPAASSETFAKYFAAAETNGADVKTAYKAGGSARDILRDVKMYAYGNKTFGEIMDAIDNSKEMTNTEKGRRRTSAYNQLAEEVKKQNIKY